MSDQDNVLAGIFGTLDRPTEPVAACDEATADEILGAPPAPVRRDPARRAYWYWAADAFADRLHKRHRPHVEQYAIATARVDECERYIGRMTQAQRFDSVRPRHWLKDAINQRSDALRQLRGLKPFGATEG